MSEREIASLVSSGGESDSFYFVNNKLIMHNKAKYTYVETNGAAAAAGSNAGGAAAAAAAAKR